MLECHCLWECLFEVCSGPERGLCVGVIPRVALEWALLGGCWWAGGGAGDGDVAWPAGTLVCTLWTGFRVVWIFEL